ncbi:MAG TPA: PEGA domain-containing protein [Myxococcales bacterium]|jgi:hypothetical protein
MRAALVLALASLLLLCPAVAAASEAASEVDTHTQDAKARFKQGVALYKVGKWGEAVEEFETAYRLKPHGVVRFNIAQCYEKLGQVAQALRSYHLYLREVPEAPDKAAVQASMAALEKSLADRGLQQLLVFSDPAGAELALDEQAQGRTPWTGELPLGKHKLALSLQGHEASTQEVLLGERSLPVEVKLAATAVAVAPPPSTTAAPVEATTPPATTKKAAPETKQRLWTWVVGGAAAATLVAAVGCGIAAKSASDQMRGSVHDQQKVQSLHDQAATNQTASNVLLGLSLAGAAAGGVLYFVGTF